MVDPEMVRVIGRSPFHDLKLASSGQLAYLGHQWRRSVASAGGDLPMQGDLSAHTLIFNVPNVDEERRQRLIDLLDINLEWRMHRVSDGQRRRVQICMGLLQPFEVLLLDEVGCHFACGLSYLSLACLLLMSATSFATLRCCCGVRHLHICMRVVCVLAHMHVHAYTQI